MYTILGGGKFGIVIEFREFRGTNKFLKINFVGLIHIRPYRPNNKGLGPIGLNDEDSSLHIDCDQSLEI